MNQLVINVESLDILRSLRKVLKQIKGGDNNEIGQLLRFPFFFFDAADFSVSSLFGKEDLRQSLLYA